MRTRYGMVLAALLAAPVTACDSDAPLDYQVSVPADLLPLSARFEARFFEQYSCSERALGAGKIDIALTATASIRRTSATFDGFPDEDLSRFDGDVSLDLRALAADGTLLARRCLPVGPGTEAAGVALAPFAPEAARVEIIDRIILVSGATQRPARLRVLDAAGKPAERVLVSLGRDRPLLATGADGVVVIRSSTVTIEPGASRAVTVLGVPGSRVDVRAESLDARTCPELSWSREIVPGLTGAAVAIAAADAGPRTLIALLRPTTATSTTNTVEILAGDEGATSLRSLSTATTAAAGPIAIAADRTNGRARIAVVAGESIELYAFDGATSRLTRGAVVRPMVIPGGAIRLLRAIPGGPPFAFAAAGDVPSGAISVTEDGVIAPLLPGADRTIVDLALTELGAYVTTAGGLEAFARVGGALVADGPVLASAKGRLVPSTGGVARVVVFGDGPIVALGDANSVLDIITPNIGAPLGLASGDLNGDGVSDLWTTSNGGTSTILVTPSGGLVDAGTCPVMGGPRQLVPLPLDRGGAPRWAVILDQSGRIGLLVGAR